VSVSVASDRTEGHSGGPAAAAYEAATRDAAFIDRSDRARVALRGRAPEQVLRGLVSGSLPSELVQAREGVWRGRAEGSALLTAKGRMIAVLRVMRGGPSPEDGFLLDLPPACRDAASEHLRKYVPPRLASASDESSRSRMLTVLGPRAGERLVELLGLDEQVELLSTMGDGDLLRVIRDGAVLVVVRTGEVATPAFDLFGDADVIGRARGKLAGSGCEELSRATWEVLRVEAGFPEFGVDMDDTTIPVEAGIHTWAVDYQKGCFTGQEVLIRIRDRGHVNRSLRGLRFGNVVPESGAQLFRPNDERPVGHVTSAVRSPRFGEVIGLGYVRREVTPPSELRLTTPDGPVVRVESLQETWRPGPGSP
jgi:folate-binding protein YgfZ